MTTTRILLVEIEGQSQFMVDRATNFMEDQLRTLATFVEGTMEELGLVGAPVPAIRVSNTSMKEEETSHAG